MRLQIEPGCCQKKWKKFLQFVGTLQDVARVIVGTVERTLKMWGMRTLYVIFFISAVYSVGWQNDQIPLWGVKKAFYN